MAKHWLQTWVGLLFVLLSVGPAFATEKKAAVSPGALVGHYFMIVWAYQGPDDDLVHAHTFASFYRGDDLANGTVRPETISWLPAAGAVHLFGSERGRNFSLDDTLRRACGAGRKVTSWGPYEIKPELFRRAMARVQKLQSGQIRYSMITSLPHSMNCITAAGDITPHPLNTGLLWGVAASAEVVRHLSPYFVEKESLASLNGLIAASTSPACQGQASQIVSTTTVSIPQT